MIYRKKLIIALVEIFGGELGATDFQKILFLLSEKQEVRMYDFVPYKFGCFSFQAMADKNSLIKEGIFENSKNWKLSTSQTSFLTGLKEDDRKALRKIKLKYKEFDTNTLIREVYLNYPYFAINSEIAPQLLSDSELKVISRFKPSNSLNSLYTIGYEGRSIEKYLNILINQNIKVLVDVRKNPLSRKYGFAKKTLQNACDSVGIKYIHLPELGIVSEKRKTLNNQADYDSLFLDYEETVLPYQKNALKLIHDLLVKYERIALTCYEALPKQCHRTRVAESVHMVDKSIPLIHL